MTMGVGGGRENLQDSAYLTTNNRHLPDKLKTSLFKP